MAIGPSDQDQDLDGFTRMQEYYQRRESKLKVQIDDFQRQNRRRGRRVAVVDLDHRVPAFRSDLSVDPTISLEEYFALKVLQILPRPEDVHVDEMSGGVRRTSLPVTLSVYLSKEYVVGPEGVLVGTSAKCNIRLPLESGLKPQHFRVRLGEAGEGQEDASAYCVESCLGQKDMAAVDQEDLYNLLETYDPMEPVDSCKTSWMRLSGNSVFIAGQFVWQVLPLPIKTVASLQAFGAVRSGDIVKLRSVLENQDNRLRGRSSVTDLVGVIFDINEEEKVGEEYTMYNDKEGQSSPNKPNVLLHIAVQMENLEMVQLLLEKGADPNCAGGSHRRTALHYGVEADSLAILTKLLEYGGDVEVKDINALPPLALAGSHQVRKLLLHSVLLCSAALEGLYDEVECCLRQPNVTPNVLGLRHKTPLQLASIAGHHRVVELLLENKANINQCGGSQWRSALHYAASGGHKETVRVLVRHGADLELKDGEWNTAANLCTQSDVLQLLSKETMPTLCDVVQSGDLEAARKLILANKGVEGYIEQRDSQMNTPLHIACRRGQLDMVRLLKEHGTNVNIIGGVEKLTPLCVAAREGCAEVVEFLIGVGAEIEGDLSADGQFSVREMVETLIEKCNTDLQQIWFTGRPPSKWDTTLYSRQQSQVSLEAAGPVQMCQETIERLECVYELLFTGPEKLMRAFENKNLDRFKTLLTGKSPVSPNCIVLPRENISILTYVCEQREYEYAKAVIDAGAELNITGQTEQMPLLVTADLGDLKLIQLLVESGIDIDLQSRDCRTTALHEAICAENLAIVSYLLKMGAQKDVKNANGETPFDLAISKEGRRLLAHGPQLVLIAASTGDVDELRRLKKEEGYDPCQLIFHAGWTAFHEACKFGHLKVVRLLVEHGINISAKGSTQLYTPLHLACIHNHIDVVKFLLQQQNIRKCLSSKDVMGRVPFEVATSNQIRSLLVLHNPVRSQLTTSQKRSVDQNLCLICKDTAVEVMLLPCEHKICCYSCAERCHDIWKACPLCRGIIKNIERC